MKTRTIGKSGIAVSPLALGGSVFGWTSSEKTSFALLDAFVAAGFNLIDTADVYSTWVPGHLGGESESILGKWLTQSGKRYRVVIATKVGMKMGPNRGGLSRAYILHAVEDSLRRLQTDYIDLYQSHTDDPTTPMEEMLQAYDDLIRQGKVRVIGASNYSVQRLSEAIHMSNHRGYTSFQSLQPLYNLYDREDYEKTLEPFCRQQGLGVITYFSLANGFLTGKYRSETDLSKSVRGAIVRKYLNLKGFRILKALDEVASKFETTPASIALAWLIARPSITSAITSATALDQLQGIIQGATVVLDQESLDLLNRSSESV